MSYSVDIYVVLRHSAGTKLSCFEIDQSRFMPIEIQDVPFDEATPNALDWMEQMFHDGLSVPAASGLRIWTPNRPGADQMVQLASSMAAKAFFMRWWNGTDSQPLTLYGEELSSTRFQHMPVGGSLSVASTPEQVHAHAACSTACAATNQPCFRGRTPLHVFFRRASVASRRKCSRQREQA